MKPVLKTAGLAAALILTLTAATAGERYRYLGRANQFAVLATEPTGPRDARMLSAVMAAGEVTGPGGSDSFIASIKSDCTGNTVQLMGIEAYAGDEKLPVAEGGAAAHAPTPDTPYQLAYDYSCAGTAPAGAPVWIEGSGAARAYALKQATGA